MPFRHERYCEGVFTCILDERVNEADAREWAQLCKRYAYAETYPIVTILDLRLATYISAIARQIMSTVASQDHVHTVAVVASDFVVEQNMRLTALMSSSKNIDIFPTIESAEIYATNRANLIRNIHGDLPDALRETIYPD